MRKSFTTLVTTALLSTLVLAATAIGQTRENFTLSGQSAFIITPNTPAAGNPWIAYAPAVGGLPSWSSAGGSGAEQWMFDQYLANGIAIAGIYAGDLSGSPAQRAGYTNLYNELINNRGYAEKFSFHVRSRGGLLGYNWTADNPDKVAAIGGIYSVSNLLSFPGASTAAAHYGITVTELTTNSHLYNPIDRLDPLIANDIPVFHLHGDSDTVVPLVDNNQIVKDYFDANGGDATLKVIPGGGHDFATHWWTDQDLTNFLINETLAAASGPLSNDPYVEVNQQTGEIKLINPSDGTADMDFRAYSLTSSAGALSPANRTTIAGNYDLSGGGLIDDDGDWTVGANTNSSFGEQAHVGGGDGLLTVGSEPSLGIEAWVRSPTQDLIFNYTDTSGAAQSLQVVYVGDDIPVGDMNYDGVVNAADWPLFRANNQADTSDLSQAEAYQFGDLNGDGRNSVSDFLLFRQAFIAANPTPGAFEALVGAPVPEPSTVALLVACVAALGFRRHCKLFTNE